MNRIMGLDVSLTATGVALAEGSTTGAEVFTICPKTKGVHRMIEVRERILDAHLNCRPDLVVIEAPSLGASKSSHAKEMGGIWWFVRVSLYEFCDTPVVEVPPSTLKKYATGKGNANKERVLVEAVKRLGYDGSDHNESDALWLAEIGLHLTGGAYTPMPAANVAALDVLEVPT